MAITCKTCKKFAKLKAVYMNGLDEIKLVGSCKNCGYDEADNHIEQKTPWDKIPKSRIDYDDFEELGVIDR